MIVPLEVGRERSIKALERAVRTNAPVALITQRSAEQDEIGTVDELHTVGTLAKIAQLIRLQNGTIRAIVQGQRRLRLLDLVQTEPYIEARVRSSPTRRSAQDSSPERRSRRRSSSTSRPPGRQVAVAAEHHRWRLLADAATRRR
jgi:ATP-dependent Lon protease